MKTNLLHILLVFVSLNTFAQSKHEKVKALKISFITERLELSQQEAQQFWPIYNAYDEITSKIKYEEIKSIRREIKDNIATLSNERASELLNQIAAAEGKLHDEEIKLNKELKKIISPKKIILLKVAEEDFKKKLFEQWKRMRQEGKKP